MTWHLTCPNCGSKELRSSSELNIKAYKVYDKEGRAWSHCLVCAGFFAGKGRFDKSKGWFTLDLDCEPE